MRLLILTRFPIEYEPQRLAEEAERKGIEAKILSYEKINLFWQKGEVKIGLPDGLKFGDFNLIIPRSGAHRSKKSQIGLKIAIIKSISAKSACLNQETFKLWPVLGKIEQGIMLAQEGIPVIPSWFLPEKVKKEVFLKTAKFPLICKGRFGSHSKKTFKVENKSQAVKIIKNHENEFFFQQLVESLYYWRVIILDNKVIGTMERETNQRFLSKKTYSKQKTYEKNNLPPKLEKLAVKVSAILRADLTGVDILIDQKGEPLVIEINRSPQYKIFEKRTGINVAENIIDFLIKKNNLK